MVFALGDSRDEQGSSRPLVVDPPLSLLFSHPLTDGRLLVASWHVIATPESLSRRLDAAREEAWTMAKTQGLNPVGTKAGARITDQHGVPGFIEAAPYNGIFGSATG